VGQIAAGKPYTLATVGWCNCIQIEQTRSPINQFPEKRRIPCPKYLHSHRCYGGDRIDFRASHLHSLGKNGSPAELAAKGLAAIQKGNVIFFGIFMPVLVGSIAFFVYRGMLSRSPDTAQTTYLLLAAGMAIAFTILAAAVFKMRGFMELTTLHLLYVAGFGWIMPRLLNM
jgi:hypothetical protein